MHREHLMLIMCCVPILFGASGVAVESEPPMKQGDVAGVPVAPLSSPGGKKPDRALPVSFEWSYAFDVAEGGGPKRPEVYGALKLSEKAIPPEELQRETEELRRQFDGQMRLEQIDGVYFLRPTGENVPPNWTIESALDTEVSMKIEQATTWEALKQLFLIVNKKNPRVTLFAFHYSIYNTAPELIRTVRIVTVNVDGVSARDALCSICAQAPLDIRWYYANNPNPLSSTGGVSGASLGIDFFEDGRELKHDWRRGIAPSREVQDWWDAEWEEALAPWNRVLLEASGAAASSDVTEAASEDAIAVPAKEQAKAEPSGTGLRPTHWQVLGIVALGGVLAATAVIAVRTKRKKNDRL